MTGSKSKEDTIIKKNRELVILISVIIVIAVCSSLILRWSQQQEPLPYSSYSTYPSGTKGAYLLLEKLNFKIARHQGGAKEIQPESILILFEPQFDYSDKNDEIKQLNQWVYNGNTMIIAGDYQKYFTYSANEGQSSGFLSGLNALEIPSDSGKSYYDKPFGMGTFRLIPDASLFLNSSLRRKGAATRLVAAVWDYYDRPVLFGEPEGTQLFEKKAQWKNSPITLLNTTWQLILFQVVVGLIGLLFLNNRPLGLPATYQEEAVRAENEDVQALAGLMERAEQYEDALLLYYQQFEKEAAVYFKRNLHKKDGLLELLWKENRLKHYEELREVLDRVLGNNHNKKIADSDVISLFQSIDILREEITNNE
ncbi:MAG: DUF4350 domain-containing protein [Clostridia bacterium]